VNESLPLAPRVSRYGEPGSAAGGEEHASGHQSTAARIGRPAGAPALRGSGLAMGFYLKNRTSERLWVVLGLLDRDCGRSEEGGGIDYAKQGWWSVAPNTEVKVWSGWAGGDAWFFYAENDDSTRKWSGDFHTLVPTNAFYLCCAVGVGGAAMDVGMRRVRPGAEYMDYTIPLV